MQGGQISALGVDVNELILELAFSPVQDPIPLSLKKRNSVTRNISAFSFGHFCFGPFVANLHLKGNRQLYVELFTHGK